MMLMLVQNSCLTHHQQTKIKITLHLQWGLLFSPTPSARQSRSSPWGRLSIFVKFAQHRWCKEIGVFSCGKVLQMRYFFEVITQVKLVFEVPLLWQLYHASHVRSLFVICPQQFAGRKPQGVFLYIICIYIYNPYISLHGFHFSLAGVCHLIGTLYLLP